MSRLIASLTTSVKEMWYLRGEAFHFHLSTAFKHRLWAKWQILENCDVYMHIISLYRHDNVYKKCSNMKNPLQYMRWVQSVLSLSVNVKIRHIILSKCKYYTCCKYPTIHQTPQRHSCLENSNILLRKWWSSMNVKSQQTTWHKWEILKKVLYASIYCGKIVLFEAQPLKTAFKVMSTSFNQPSLLGLTLRNVSLSLIEKLHHSSLL